MKLIYLVKLPWLKEIFSSSEDNSCKSPKTTHGFEFVLLIFSIDPTNVFEDDVRISLNKSN